MYEVTTNWATAMFSTQNDAINAVWLLGQEKQYDFSHAEIQKALARTGYWENPPLSIAKING